VSSLEDEAIKQGDLLRDEDDFDGAIAAYTEAIRLHPQNAQPYSNRGQAYLRKGEFSVAQIIMWSSSFLQPYFSMMLVFCTT